MGNNFNKIVSANLSFPIGMPEPIDLYSPGSGMKLHFFHKIKETGDPPEGWGVQAQRRQIKGLRGGV